MMFMIVLVVLVFSNLVALAIVTLRKQDASLAASAFMAAWLLALVVSYQAQPFAVILTTGIAFAGNGFLALPKHLREYTN